jgi:hypothetical protein
LSPTNLSFRSYSSLLPLSLLSLPLLSPLEDDEEESDDPDESPPLFGEASGLTLLGMLCVSALGFPLSPDGFLFPDFSVALFRGLSPDLFAESAAFVFDDSELEFESELEEPSELLPLSELLSESSLIHHSTLRPLKNQLGVR